MATDSLILKRFDDLLALAERVEKSRKMGASHSEVIDTALFRQWSTSAQSLIDRACGTDSPHATNFKSLCADFQDYYYQFRDCHGVLVAAADDYRGGHLSKLRALIDAELCSDVLDQADVLFRANHKDPSCILAGIVLERALKELCRASSIPEGKLDKMNSELARAGAYNVGMQKQITAWADRRNNAAHGNWSAYSDADVRDMIDGVRRFIAEKM